MKRTLCLLIILCIQLNGLKAAFTCDVCKFVVNAGLGWANDGDSRDEIVDKFVDLCVTLEIQKEYVCRALAEANIDLGLWIYNEKNSTEYPVTADTVCGFTLYPDSECTLEGSEFEWSLDLSFTGTKPPVQEPQLPPEGSPTLKVLHLTDLHVDPNYLPGGNAVCGDLVCCRADQGPPGNASDAAGYWGDYRDCDAPVHAFIDLLENAAVTHPDIDYVIFTGDVIDHALWMTSVENNSATFTFVMAEIRRNFPDIPIFPILGNHEPHPLDVFSPTDAHIPKDVSTRWLYELAAATWGSWLPGIETSVLRGGFYSHEVRPGLLVVAINNNVCNHLNWWLIYDNYDSTGQLMWLAETLLQAEAANQKVHILAHIHSGSSNCWSTWSREYRRVIDRFEGTVVAQFHGHTHRDHFNIYYDLTNSSRATNVAFIGGSGTAYSDYNPNYRIYTVDGEHQDSSYRVLDHETWFYNLTEANLAGPDVPPNWQKLYTFSQAYDVPSLLPADLDDLVYRMAVNVTLQEQYHRYYVKLGDPSLAKGCSPSCLRRLVCNIVTTVYGDSSKCDQLPLPTLQ